MPSITGIAESSASTQEVSASTEETSASAQEISASAQELAGNAEVLNQLVAQFKTNTPVIGGTSVCSARTLTIEVVQMLAKFGPHAAWEC